MRQKIKNSLLLIFFVFLFVGGTQAFAASTSGSITDYDVMEAMTSRYGEDYNAPYTASAGGNVDLSDGSVNVTETDLSLPGKNGFDLNIVRKYRSQDMHEYFAYDNNGIMRWAFVYPVARYTYESAEGDKIINVAFPREEDILDTFYAEEGLDPSHYTKYDDGDMGYFEYTKIVEENGVVCQRIKNEKLQYVGFYTDSRFQTETEKTTAINLGAGWQIELPGLAFMYNDFISVNRNDQRVRWQFTSMNGEKYTMGYAIYEEEDGTYTPENGDIINSADYDAEVYPQLQTHEDGFQYNVRIDSKDGMQYYFNLKSFSNFWQVNTALPVAVTDRFGNRITYSQDEDGAVTIVDTMGRVVTVSASGIQVSDGQNTKEILYSLEEVYDQVRDPQGKIKYFSDYVLRVQKNRNAVESGTPDYETTQYVMRYSGLTIENSPSAESLFHNFKLKKIVYPTGGYITYDYAAEPGVGKNVLGSPTNASMKYDYYDYQAQAETVYEDNAQKNQKTYRYTFSKKPTSLTGVEQRKTSLTEEMLLPNGHRQEAQYSLDYFGRAIEKAARVYDGSEMTEYTREEYSYSEGENIKAIKAASYSKLLSRPFSNCRTFEDGNLIKSEDYKYNNKKEKLYEQLGEVSSTYTYDDKYSLCLSQESQMEDGRTIKVENTLTPDGKNIASSKTYENGALRSETQYSYHDDGTLAQQTLIGDQENVVTKYQYTYQPNGAYTVKTIVEDVADADGQLSDIVTEKDYDTFGNLAADVDAEKNQTNYTYDMNGRVLTQTNPDATQVRYAYDIANNILSVTDENGNTITRDYSQWGNLMSVYQGTNPSDLLLSYDYDALNRKTYEASYAQPGVLSGNVSYTYDDLGRIAQTVSKDGSTVLDAASVSYAYAGRYVQVSGPVDISGTKKVLLAVEARGGEEYVKIRLDGGETQSLGKLIAGESGTFVLDTENVSTLEIESEHNVHLLFLPKDSPSDIMGGEELETVTTYQGDATYTKPTERVITDAFGNVIEESFYNGSVSDTNLLNKNLYKYDYQGNVTEALGGRTYMENLGTYTTKTEYDYMGNPVKSYRADGDYVTAAYDKLGRKISETDYMGNQTTYTYDKLGRTIKTQTPFEENETSETISYYDGNGNVVKTRQKNNNIGESAAYAETENEYDSRNRLVSVRVNDGERNIYTQYAYDNVGNMLRMVTGQTEKINDLFGQLPEGATWVDYAYDAFGNVTKETDALGRNKTAEYNQMGLPTKVTDKKGVVTENTYNAYGSILQSQTAGEPLISSQYTVNNLPVGTYKGNISNAVAYRYDAYGNITKELESGTEIQKDYIYDVNGNRRSFTMKRGSEVLSEVNYTYDALDRITEVDFGGNVGKVNYTYDENGRLLTETRGGITTTYSYNKGGLVKTMDNSQGSSYAYTYRLDGSQIKKEDSQQGTTEYEYDDIGQLKQEKKTKEGQEEITGYSYDSRGNRIGMTNESSTGNYIYNQTNQLLKETRVSTESEVQINYTYDENGNVIFKGTELYEDITEGEESISGSVTGQASEGEANAFYYTYNNFNQLVNVENDKGMTASYDYDALGRRNSKTVNGATSLQVWDGDNIIYEADGNWNKVASYYRGTNPVAIDNGTVDYYLYNSHGDVVGMKNEGSTIVYDAFGNQKNDTTTSYNPFRYNSQYTDEETGLIYLRNRYYDSSTGRFMTEDPIKDGLNWYTYANNNPVTFVDPSGLIITLVGSEDEMKRSFDQLQALTNDELTYDKETGIVTIVNTGTMNTDKKLTAGSKMVADLIDNGDFNAKIERIYEENGGCYYKNATDSGITIQMNDWAEAGGNWFYEVSDGTGGTAYDDHRDVAHIVLGHELIHATHYMNGTVADPLRTVYRDTNTGLVVDIREDLNMSEEYNTVGLYHIVEYPAVGNGIAIRRFYIPLPGSLTENTLRAEHGLTNRTAY